MSEHYVEPGKVAQVIVVGEQSTAQLIDAKATIVVNDKPDTVTIELGQVTVDVLE